MDRAGKVAGIAQGPVNIIKAALFIQFLGLRHIFHGFEVYLFKSKFAGLGDAELHHLCPHPLPAYLGKEIHFLQLADIAVIIVQRGHAGATNYFVVLLHHKIGRPGFLVGLKHLVKRLIGIGGANLGHVEIFQYAAYNPGYLGIVLLFDKPDDGCLHSK